MTENEFRVRPVTRYNVTHYLSDGSSGSCASLGEFTSLEAAERVARAMHAGAPGSTFATLFKGAEIGGPKPDRFPLPHAVAALKVALHTVENNEPINRAEGKEEQANLEAESAEDIRAALALIGGGSSD